MASENLPAMSVRPNNFADTFKTCSTEFIENGKEFHLFSAVCVLPVSTGKRNYRFSIYNGGKFHPPSCENLPLKIQ